MSREYKSFPAIYELVKEVPEGQVASYGMIASLIKNATPRIVGFAMAGTPTGQDIPWQRVINSAGAISEREGAERQRSYLKAEGVKFKPNGKVDWKKHRWQGPNEKWLADAGIDFMDFLEIQAKWPG
jgi:methylated-DNA-protein-cysteine methyltransferase-like protein